MAMTMAVSLRTARAQAIADAIDAGDTPGYMKILTAPRPVTGAALTEQIDVGTLTFSKPCGTVASGVLNFAAIAPHAAANHTVIPESNLPLWARIYNGNGGFVADLSVSTQGGGGDVILNTVMIIAGGAITPEGPQAIYEGGV